MDKNKILWHISRTLLFYIIGVFNTILIRPEDSGSFKNYLGYLILLIAVADTIYIIYKFRRNKPVNS